MGFFDPFGGNTGGSGNGGGGSNVSVDTTLTQSGKAADAKVTGDKIKKIETDGVATINSVKVVGELDSINDLRMIKEYGADAVLVGEMFMRNIDNAEFQSEYAEFKGEK